MAWIVAAVAPSQCTTSVVAPSIARFSSLAEGVFKVLATNGDTYLGGDDFDRLLMQIAAKEMKVDLAAKDAELLQQPSRRPRNARRLHLAARRHAELIVQIASRGIRFSRTFTRAEFEELIRPLIDRSLDRCKAAIRDAQLTAAEDRRGCVGRWLDTHSVCAGKRVAEFLRQDAPHWPQSR